MLVRCSVVEGFNDDCLVLVSVSVVVYLFIKLFTLCYIYLYTKICRCSGCLPGRFVAGHFLRRTARSNEFVLAMHGVNVLCGDCF